MTKKIELKELREAYAVEIDPARLSREPVILQRDDTPIAAVISMAEYRLYCAWKEQLTLSQLPAQFLEDRAAFQRMLPELLKTHKEKWIAVYQGQVVDSAENVGDLAERVYARLGYRAIFMSQVLEEPRVYRLPSPRLVR
ncbi:MAG: DUF5678 domain-containing protein [Anaerolineales bacterium]|nr:DUF5678 domain-containing protein [Anaerolineales bacterium]